MKLKRGESAKPLTASLTGGDLELPRSKKAAALIILAIAIVPLVHNTLWGLPGYLPWRLNEFWRVAVIFTHRMNTWPSNQVLYLDDEGSWQELAQEEVFPHRLFGEMTRLDMLVMNFRPHPRDVTEVKRQKEAVFLKLCQAFVDKFRHHPIQKIQFVQTSAPSSRDGAPASRWSRRVPVDLPGAERQVLFECQVNAP